MITSVFTLNNVEGGAQIGECLSLAYVIGLHNTSLSTKLDTAHFDESLSDVIILGHGVP